MGEHVPAHIRLDARTHDVADGLHVVVGGRVDDAQKDVRPTQQKHGPDGQRLRRAGEIAHDQRQRQIA